jgi:D-hydroxyproline dehydrogenase subunit gamma
VRATVSIRVDGRPITVPAGMSVAAVLLDDAVIAFRRSSGGEARGPVCGMGTCFECRVTIDGVAHRRSCLAPVADGMTVETATSGSEVVP